MTATVGGTCCVFNCRKHNEYVIGSMTTERLNETWAACADHIPTVIRYIKERSEAWGRTDEVIAVAEIARG